jgi:hypothetical protein
MDVEQHEIPFLLAQHVERLIAAGSLADRMDGRIRLQELLETRSDNRVIVCDQYS